MRMVFLCLIFTTMAALSALAGACTGAASQIQLLSKDLARNLLSAAESILVPLEASHPECPELVLARARIKAGQGAADEAQSLFSQYAAQVPDSASGNAYYARFLIDQGEYRRADTLSALALEQAPNSPAALAVRGQILAMKGEPQEGLELLKKSCQLDPEDAEAQFQLGSIYDGAHRPQEAVQHFEKVVKLDPENAPAWDYLALNLEPLGDLDRAEAAYQHGLAVNRQGPHFDAFLDYNYGRFLAKRNRLMESMKYLNRAVALVPQVRATWYERAKLDLRLHKYRQARSDGEKAASLTDQTGGIIDLQIYVLLERIYQRTGETALARKYAQLSRDTPPPVRKEYQQATPQ